MNGREVKYKVGRKKERRGERRGRGLPRCRGGLKTLAAQTEEANDTFSLKRQDVIPSQIICFNWESILSQSRGDKKTKRSEECNCKNVEKDFPKRMGWSKEGKEKEGRIEDLPSFTFLCVSSLSQVSIWEGGKSRWTATTGSEVVQSGRPIFDDSFQHLWTYIGNNTGNVVFQRIKRLWLIRIDQ
ncbi:hypothetical protein TNCV_2743351 [Trichonephila clavipes]|nr:hypothetical protein TNCV_2743351 [Trichonephila clavipes]